MAGLTPFRRLRECSDRTPLRIKLIAAVLLLVVLALAVISVATVYVMRSYLVTRADAQLGDAARQLVQQVEGGRAPRGPDGKIILAPPYGVVVQLRDARGTLLQSVLSMDRSAGDTAGPALTGDVSQRAGRPFSTSAANGDGDRWRVLVLDLSGGGTVTLALNLKEVDRTVHRLTTVDLLVGGMVVLVLAAAGVWIVRTSLRPLDEIEDTAEAIAEGDLSRRVPERHPRTEVGRLGRSLNGMLGQIETAFRSRAESEEAARRSEAAARSSEESARNSEERMRRFVADASHELRTPLTAIRGFAEFYRQGAARSPAETDRLLRRIEDSASRMGLLVEDLLLLARMDRQRSLERRPVDLLALAADAVQEARVMAPGRNVELSVRGGVAYQVLGDEPRLRQVLGNLLTNAITHTPDGTPVEVRLATGTLPASGVPLPGASAETPVVVSEGVPASRAGAQGVPGPSVTAEDIPGPDAAGVGSAEIPAVICEVADQGPGLSPDEVGRIFERFYRADAARSEGGTGLGLAIVAALVAAHGGTVEVDTEPGRGATFRIALPLAPD
ncbi:MAG: two-component system, OmpR family, sensor kinase [Streptosporangiaceae bacterium]|jgi:two-component system OmpR family sensor kinase|nr:histidine kinase [Streptosporangiaceae bacterium]MDX6433032.1 two-component system, OmpR family, sensor kinase [Streptosporangiaceae bacterium]